MNHNIFLAALPCEPDKAIFTKLIQACDIARPPDISVRWTHPNDLHITLGFMRQVDEKDFLSIGNEMQSISEYHAFKTHLNRIELFNNAIVFTVEPFDLLHEIYQKMQLKLIAATDGLYQFDNSKQFRPHLTIGRIENIETLSFIQKRNILAQIKKLFIIEAILINQAGLLFRSTNQHYKIIQSYNLIKKSTSN